MSQRITIQIIDKIATCLTELPVVCGNSDYECEFLFDEEWEQHSIKTARFKVNGDYTDVVFEGNICNMPIISDAKIVWIGVFAGELSTSTPAIVHCKHSILDGEDTPAPPREDVYSQIVTMCEEAVETARSVEERADNGEFNGKDGKDGKDADVDTSNLCNVLLGSKQGEVITINDASPIKKDIAVKVWKKNLFNIHASKGFESQYGGLTNEINENSIKVIWF